MVNNHIIVGSIVNVNHGYITNNTRWSRWRMDSWNTWATQCHKATIWEPWDFGVGLFHKVSHTTELVIPTIYQNWKFNPFFRSFIIGFTTLIAATVTGIISVHYSPTWLRRCFSSMQVDGGLVTSWGISSISWQAPFGALPYASSEDSSIRDLRPIG